MIRPTAGLAVDGDVPTVVGSGQAAPGRDYPRAPDGARGAAA